MAICGTQKLTECGFRSKLIFCVTLNAKLLSELFCNAEIFHKKICFYIIFFDLNQEFSSNGSEHPDKFRDCKLDCVNRISLLTPVFKNNQILIKNFIEVFLLCFINQVLSIKIFLPQNKSKSLNTKSSKKWQTQKEEL